VPSEKHVKMQSKSHPRTAGVWGDRGLGLRRS